MGVRSLIRQILVPEEAQRADLPLSFDEFLSYFTFQGSSYLLSGLQQTIQGNKEEIGADFAGFATGTYKGNSVVFACEAVRMLLFSEARFQFREIKEGRPGKLFGTSDLNILGAPWPGGTTGDLLAKALLDADLAGNAFIARTGNRLQRLRPDWITIVMGSRRDPNVEPWDIGAEVIGYLYQPGGSAGGKEKIPLPASQVAHFAPYPDPISPFRGMSWLTPVIREIQADAGMTTHKQKFIENGASPNGVVKLDITDLEKFQAWVENFEKRHTGAQNAARTLFLGAGADYTVVGSNLSEMNFADTQGAGETRIAAASGIHPSILGLREGLQGASLNAGNFAAARRLTADKCLRPLWRNFCGSMARITRVPPGSELWYDERDIAFLREDQKDAAEIFQFKATSLQTLVNSGFEAKSAIAAVAANDETLLKHTGKVSVQLQEPGAKPTPPSNGKVLAEVVP